MITHYTEMMWLMVGIYLLLRQYNPVTAYIGGAMITVLSLIKIFGV